MSSDQQYVKPAIASKKLGVNPTTLRTWAKKGLISFIITPGNQRLYDTSSVITTATPDSKPTKEKKKSSTVESRQTNKKKTSIDKSITFDPSIQSIPLFPRSRLELTSEGKPYKGFWTNQSKEISKKLWLPTGTGCVGLPMNTSSGYSQNLESVSSSTILRTKVVNRSSLTTSCPLSTCSLVDTTVKGGNVLLKELKSNALKKDKRLETMYKKRMENKGITVSRDQPITDKIIPSAKIVRLALTPSQIKTFDTYFQAYNKIWNMCLYYIHTHREEVCTEVTLRNIYVIKKNMPEDMKSQLEWTFKVPKRVREYAIRDLISNIKSGLTSVRRKRIKKSNIKYKNGLSKKGISLAHESSKIEGMFLTVCGMKLLLTSSITEGEIKHNMRLAKVDGQYQLSIPTYTSIPLNKKPTPDNVVSLDPGNNIFHTYYCPDGEYGEIGNDLRDKIERKYEILDKLRKKHKMKTWFKKHRRLMNQMDDIHWKLCHWLLSHFRRIVIPRLYVRKANHQVKRLMHVMRQPLFVDRLIQKSIGYQDSEIHVCTEPYTTKTCTICGSKRTYRGKVVRCRECGFEMHRDVSASRNILLSHLELIQ